MPKTFFITGRPYPIAAIPSMLAASSFRLAPGAVSAMRRSRRVIERILAHRDRVVYGVNTGFGKLASVRIPAGHIEELQVNLIRSHAVGVGDALPAEDVKLIMLLRANSLARGCSGIRESTVRLLLAMAGRGVYPVVPSQGSVGASGDLAPLAHIVQVMTGEGEADYRGRRMRGDEALRRAGLRPVALAAKEGLALINGTPVMTAILARVAAEMTNLVRAADGIGAMSLEALHGSRRPFDPRVQAIRPHPGQALVARNVRALLAGSRIMESHRQCSKVQDSYCLRCIPQVHGAVRDSLAHVIRVVEIEIGAVTDNPLIFAAGGDVISAGNFHGEPVAIAADLLAIAASELASISERRIETLINPDLSGLPPFLTKHSGLHSGFMMLQVTASALVSENKVLAHPASVDSIPTSANKEDHVSMGVTAALKARRIVNNVAHVLAIEALAAAQALDFVHPLRSSRAIEALHRETRRLSRFMARDRSLAPDIVRVAARLKSGELLAAAKGGPGLKIR